MSAYRVKFGDRQTSAKLLRAYGQAEGLGRVRFTPPCPEDLTGGVTVAMAEIPNAMP